MKKNTRKINIIETAKEVLESEGPRFTTIDAVIQKSGTPRGSFYYYFPKGRTQLVEEAIFYASEQMINMMNLAFDENNDLEQCIDVFFDLWGNTLVQKEYKAGCAVFAVATEYDSVQIELQKIVKETLKIWESTLADKLLLKNVDKNKSNKISELIIASGEGAIVLCRVKKSLEPMMSIATLVKSLL